LVQDVGGSLMVLADQVRRAVAWVYENIARFGGDPNRLYLGGQSSGGHLAAVALTTDWRHDFDLPADIVKGGLCISGMYDLVPVRLSARSRYVAFDDATVAALSPIRHIGAAGRRLRHLRDPRIPAPEPRIRCRGRKRRQAGSALGRRAL
jgi:arylformamidase